MRKSVLPSAGSFLKDSQQPGPGLRQSQELGTQSGSPWRVVKPSTNNVSCCLPGCILAASWVRTWTQAFCWDAGIPSGIFCAKCLALDIIFKSLTVIRTFVSLSTIPLSNTINNSNSIFKSFLIVSRKLSFVCIFSLVLWHFQLFPTLDFSMMLVIHPIECLIWLLASM